MFIRHAAHIARAHSRTLTVGNICRTVRGRVAGEAEADKLDAVCRAFADKIRTQPGYV